ncbi:MAG: FAD-dependent oxidoreductase [Thermoleophilia bacterium]|nr:FAD-dependent oxidoreductase [Thermoleophilia bacterium]
MADSFWLAETAPTLRSEPLAGAADVEIIGGGVTGISAALTLARDGKRVRLHEARAIASGASGRNGGFALRGGAMAYDSAREWLGGDTAAAYWRLTEQYVDRMGELGGDAFRRTGSLRLAGADERDELRAEYEALREDGFAAEWRDELPAPLAGRFPGALFHPDDAVLQPARLVRRLAAAAADAGVEIREHDRVEDLAALEADTVLVATDGYPSGLLGELEGLIIPTRGQMIATEPLPERQFTMPHYGRHGFDYWHQNEEGRLIVGGFRDADMDSEFTAEEATTERIQNALERFAADLLGREPTVTHRWAGVFGLVPDLMPVVGRHPGRDGLWIAGGYSGHGNVLGLMCGDLVAQAILGEAPPLLERMDPARLVA